MTKQSQIPELGLADFLRHAVSGGVALGTFYFCGEPTEYWSIHMISDHIVAIGGSTVFFGTVLYGLHRGFTNMVVEWARFHASPCFMEQVMPILVTQKIIEHWKYKSASDRSKQAGYLKDWADIVHATYTSAQAMGGGALAAYFLCAGVELETGRFAFSILFAVLIFAAGFVNDCRRHRVEEVLYGGWKMADAAAAGKTAPASVAESFRSEPV